MSDVQEIVAGTAEELVPFVVAPPTVVLGPVLPKLTPGAKYRSGRGAGSVAGQGSVHEDDLFSFSKPVQQPMPSL